MRRFKLNHFFLSLIGCALIAVYVGHAENIIFNSSSSLLNTIKQGHITAQLGFYQGIQGKEQHIDIPSLIGDQFTVSKNRDTSGLLGLGYYLDGQQWTAVKMLYGLNLFYLAQMKVSGTVIQENLFPNLSYRYYVSHLPFFLIVKSIIQTNSSKYDIGVDAGAGPNFMFLKGFSESPLNPASVPDKPFKNTTSIRLGATFGLSLRINHLIRSMPVEIGYRFFYLGNGRFNHTNQVSSSLNTGNTYANAIICSVTL